MRDRLEFVFPVGAPIGPDEDDCIACLVEASLPVVEASQVQKVAEFDTQRDDSGVRHHDFRAWNGALVGGSLLRQNAESIRGVDEGYWRRALGSDLWLRCRSNPFQIWGGLDAAKAKSLVADADSTPELRKRVDEAKQRLANSVVVDGQIWFPTDGPRLLSRSTKNGMTLFVSFPQFKGPGLVEDGDWSAFDLEAFSRGVGAHGNGVAMRGGRLEVLSRDGWDMEAILDRAAVAALDRMISRMCNWGLRIKKGDAGEEVVAAEIALREVPASTDESERREVAREYIEHIKAAMRGSVSDWAIQMQTAVPTWSTMLDRMETRAIERGLDAQGLVV